MEKKKEKSVARALSLLDNLKKELKQCRKERDDYLAGWQRARADFLNYKKEEAGRTERILDYANEELILKILPILDNIYLAEKEIPKDLKNNKWVEGILQIRNYFQDFLRNQGVEEIKSIGEKFNPNFHEVVETVEKEDKDSGVIVEEIQKGYKLKGKLIRAAKVKVSKYN